MRNHAEAAAVFDGLDRLLEPRVCEGLDLPALVADEMVMMIAVGARRLVACDPVPEVDALDESVLGEDVEDAVDAREPHRRSLSREIGMDLLRASAAGLGGEVVDQRGARRTRAVPGPAQSRPCL